jgi:branched-chain amino acid aminotransferase
MHHCYQNGKIQPVADATMPINDLGLLRGYGLFDYFRTYQGKPFQWDWYWERYENSAKLLRLANPLEKKQAYEIVMQLIKLSGSADCSIRFVLTGGYSEDSVSAPTTNILIISEDIHPVKTEEYENGIKVITYEYVRDLPEVKSTDYKHLMIMQQDIKAAKASDLLFHKDGFISELSRSNVFIFKENILITPDKNILKGITRRLILALAKEHFEIQERDITLQEVLAADEVFTTSTIKRALAITQIDDHKIANGKAGKNTKFLLSLINNCIEKW